MLRSTKCLRADWEVTIQPRGPKWCELFLILYRTPFSTKLKVNTTDAVTVCLFRLFTIKQIILKPVTVAKHLIVLTVLEDSCVALLWNSDRSLFQHSDPLSCQLTYYAKLKALAVCIHTEGPNLCMTRSSLSHTQTLNNLPSINMMSDFISL